MPDKIKPLKIENPATGGSQTDPFPVEANPTEDYIAAKGTAFENADDKLMDLDGSGNIQFKDATETTYVQLWKLRRAIYEIFDPTGTTLTSTNTEDAIKELMDSICLGLCQAKAVVDGTTVIFTMYDTLVDSSETHMKTQVV